MKHEKKLFVAVIAGTLMLLIMGTWMAGMFKVSGQPQGGESVEGDMAMAYQTFPIMTQEPVTISGLAQLQTDHSYYYNAENGKLDVLNVTDGQKVSKGDLLFTYKQDKADYDVQDLEREQTKLYNQREALIGQLQQVTGLLYNYQGDQIAANWSGNGKGEYYVVNPIGPSYSVPSAKNSEEGSEEQVAGDDGESIKEQIRQINDQIAELEIKLLRAKDAQHSKVIADFGGKVMVDESGLYNQNVPLVRIISDEVVVVGSVDEYEFYLLGDKRQAKLLVNAENREVTGEMIRYDKIPAAQSQAVDGKAVSENNAASGGAKYGFTIAADEFIQPGFSVKVKIILPGYLIPNDAIIEEADGAYVFTYQDGKAHKQKVTIEKQGLNSVVYRGLEEGQKVILMPYDIQDGQAIEIFDEMMEVEQE